MNYIYDIILNFNKEYYDFYDWSIEDEITEVRKIPLIKVDCKVYNDLILNTFKLDELFLEKIKNKCEIYIGKSLKRITAFLLTDGDNITAFKIDKNIEYSSLQVDDELDILDELEINDSIIKYDILNKKNIVLKTRNQESNENFIKKELSHIFIENNISKIKYIYYECFNKKENRIDIIKKRLYENNNSFEIMNKLYNVLTNINTINN